MSQDLHPVLLAGMVGAATSCSPVFGQIGGDATWLWEVTTNDGDEIVEPGETASISLTMLMEPVVPPEDLPFALSIAQWNTLGATNADLGEIVGWEIPGHLIEISGDLTTTDGVSLFGSNVFQCPSPQKIPCSLDNPIHILTFEWATDNYSEYEVAYSTETLYFEIKTKVFSGFSETHELPVNEALISFQVIPAPPASAGIAIGLALCARRKR